MLINTLFRFKARKIPTDFSHKLHPRMNTGAFPKHCFHLILLHKFQFVSYFFQIYFTRKWEEIYRLAKTARTFSSG